MIASDLSAAALAVAAGNAEALGVAGRVRLRGGRLGGGIVGGLDLVVSNPPYVTSAEMDELPRDVAFEPRLALDGGRTAWTPIGTCSPRWPSAHARVGGSGLEVDSRRDAAVAELARGIWPEAVIDIVADLAHRPRVVEVRPETAVITIEAAAAAIRAGEVVVIPTDTVYGLAGDPSNPGGGGAHLRHQGEAAAARIEPAGRRRLPARRPGGDGRRGALAGGRLLAGAAVAGLPGGGRRLAIPRPGRP